MREASSAPASASDATSPHDDAPALVVDDVARIASTGGSKALAARLAASLDPASLFELAVELSRETGAGKSPRESFWERLLAYAYDDPTEAADAAAARGVTAAAAYAAVAIEAEGLDESGAPVKLGEVRRTCLETLRSRCGEIVVVERGGALIFLCPTPLEADAADVRTAAGLIPRATSKTIKARLVGGVGRRADLIATQRSVEEARAAAFITRRFFAGSRVMSYDALGAYPLLLRANVSQQELQAFAARVITPLKTYDDKNQAELVRTLRVYFDRGQNVKTAAAELCVHRHTVFYRLRQIAEIGGYDLGSAHDQLALRTALAIDALQT
jgi:sugar diacid utilization regulator